MTTLNLAKEILNDRVTGTGRIDMDWGNHYIDCCHEDLKKLLIELCKDYVRLRELESNLSKIQCDNFK